MALTVEDLYTQILGRAPDAEGLAYWQNAFGGSVDPMEQASFMQAAQGELARRTPAEQAVLAPNLVSATTAPPAVTNADILGWFNANPNADATLVNQTMQAAGVSPSQVSSALASNPDVAKTYLTQQILGQGTTDKWSGQGFGSAEANAADMAKILAGIGITDINQFGQIQKTVVDEDGNKSVVTTYGNKVTGQEVPNTYSERQTGNAFGGTFVGKGNTGYRVEFAPNGTPIFYTTGASSSDAGDWMPIVQLALAATGAGGLLGNALLGTGASQIASSALGNAILGGATTGLAGGDALKGALLGGAGGALSGYLQGGPIDASNMTTTQFNDALENQLIKSMQGAGLTNSQITQFLENASPTDIASITSKLPVTGASDTLLVNAARTPITSTDLINTLSQVPTVVTTATRPEQVSPDVLNAVTSILGGGATAPPTVDVTATRPTNPDIPVITTIPTVPTITAPTVTTPTTTTPTTKDTSLTPSDIIRILGIGTTIAGINAAINPTTTTPTTYPIVDVPANWATPPKTGVAPATVLPPINFGDRNLLIGTQWEKFLDPNYGQVPEPIQYSQPSSLSYNDLMGILGSKQGMPSASTLSINDIISGIQNQYGQAPSRTMG
jgi:hypothetical protein